MNGFTKHGITHTSASQINMYTSAPCAWAAKYIFKRDFSTSAAMWVGKHVEQVVQDVLLGDALEDALKRQIDAFNHRFALCVDEKECARVHDIEPMALEAIAVLEQYGAPDFPKDESGKIVQHAIDLMCKGNDWSLPVKGYMDFVYPKHKLIIDLKTTLRCPSVMSASHQRQGAIYAAANSDYDVKFLYVTPKKSNLISVDSVNETMQDIKTILTRQEKLLLLMDEQDLRQSMPVNLESFYWRNSESVAKELYG